MPCHAVLSRMMALRMTSSLRMVATMATLAGFPAARRRSQRQLAADRHQHSHIECGSNAGTAAGDRSSATALAAVVAERSDADKSADLAAGQCAKLGQVGD